MIDHCEVWLYIYITKPCACHANKDGNNKAETPAGHDHLRNDAGYKAYNDKEYKRLMCKIEFLDNMYHLEQCVLHDLGVIL